jgi:5-(carboxyamino)imidazole ribonucleotide synthase
MRLGILGGGQLGRMLAMAGQPLAIRTTVLDPSDDPCAGQVCAAIHGEYDDRPKLDELIRASDVITYEFENVPVETARWLAGRIAVYPPPRALEVSQDRVVEKTFLKDLGIPVPPFAAIESRAEFDEAIQTIGIPSVLKTRRFGYDGKGQMVLRQQADVESAWRLLGGRPLILEGFVPFERELSLLAVRSLQGDIRTYPLVENEHREGMLFRSIAPAPRISKAIADAALDYAGRILRELQYVGVLAMEWFLVDGELRVNEIAPRVHNSGHWSIEGAVTSQFENHVRAVLGLPLGETAVPRSCVMHNLIGCEADFASRLSDPRAKLHWYGKVPKPRRKVGHVTVVD